MTDVLPYKAEYAKSGRASCKGCKKPIAANTLRMAVMVQSHMFDGKVPHWYHFQCFFVRQQPKTVGDIAHFDTLKWNDQEKIKAKLEGDGTSNGPGKGKGTKRAASSQSTDLKDFIVEYAKSNVSTCKGCNSKILKGEVRISKTDFESEEGKRYGGIKRWHHIDCIANLRDNLEFWESGELLPGFKKLKKEDQKTVKEKFPKVIGKEKQADNVDGPSPPKKIKNDKEEAKLKQQNQRMYKHRDILKNFQKRELQMLLAFNSQKIPVGIQEMLDRLSDIMTFGALEKCEVCKDGQLVYQTGVGYQCTGNLTSWTKCQNKTLEPKRRPFEIPLQYKNDYEELKKYKYTPTKRIFPVNLPSTPSAKANATNLSQTVESPFKDMEFVVIGKTTKTKAELKNEIEKLGGKIVTKVHDKLAAVIANLEEVNKMNKKMKEVKNCDIQVVSEDFLDEAKNGGIAALISKKNICSWGSEPSKRIVEVVSTSIPKKTKSIFTKSVPSKVKLKLKGGAAVDPASGVDGTAHVYKDNTDAIYSVVLSVTDIVTGRNSYYKLQLLESDSGGMCWIFRSWGRIGTTIGNTKLETINNLNQALIQFKKIYNEKTGNTWESRHNFIKHPGLFYPVDLDYNQEEDNLPNIGNSDIQCKLDKPIQELVQLIFDVNLMKQAMLEFELDLEKMPLGKLSKKQIQQAFKVLTELQDLVKNGGSDNLFLDASNRFYTLIPHDFGVDIPPILNSEDVIKQKTEMLNSLMEIEIAYSLLKSTSGNEGDVHPLDIHYEKLNTHIEILKKNTKEFELLKKYVKNTHAVTHSNYELEILEAFKIVRKGEAERYKTYKKLHNRMLLWHGSRLTNFAGILSQGLRIAPPEAPATGYMFGKGIYFADMVSKSANYCFTSQSNPTGLMLLCEVALGNMYERPHGDYIVKLPKGKHSTKGLGRTEPNPAQNSVRKDGVVVPIGEGISVDQKNLYLLYNEYIVYDISQVNMQYLLKMDFKFKY